MTASELTELQAKLQTRFKDYQAQGLKLNMARGKPATDQLDLSMEMLNEIGRASCRERV